MARISSLFLLLTRAPPLLYLLLYLLLIPGFAFAYWKFCGDGFYAPYAHLEQTWVEMMRRLRSGFAHSLEETINGMYSGGEEYKKKDTSADVYSVEIANNGAEIKLQVRFRARLLKPYNYPYLAQCYIILGTDRLIGSEDDQDPSQPDETLYARVLYDDISCDKELLSFVLPKFGTDMMVFNLDKPVAYVAVQAIKGFNGQPTAVAGNYIRMLYMSVVIVTTLGLGDIVPISQLSRLLVGTEAILGIILAGLFLNAIAWKASNLRSALLRAGWYKARIVEAIERPSKCGGDLIEITVGFLTAGGNERFLRDWLTGAKLRNACEAVGVLAKYDAAAVGQSDFLGHEVRIKLGVEKKQGYPKRNLIEDYASASSSAPLPDAPPRVQTNQTIVPSDSGS